MVADLKHGVDAWSVAWVRPTTLIDAIQPKERLEACKGAKDGAQSPILEEAATKLPVKSTCAAEEDPGVLEAAIACLQGHLTKLSIANRSVRVQSA